MRREPHSRLRPTSRLFPLGNAAAEATFRNEGRLVKTAGTGTGATSISVAFHNAGAVEVNAGRLALSGGGISAGNFTVGAGTTLELTGGAQTLNGGLLGTGEVISRSTVTFTKALNFPGVVTIPSGTATIGAASTIGEELRLSGGTLKLESDLEVTRRFNWTGGIKDGGGTLLARGGLILDGGGQKELRAGTVANGGSGTLGAGIIFIHRGATLANAAGARLIVVGAPSFGTLGSGPGEASFRNEGTLTRADGSPTGILSIPVPFTQTATGTLALRIGGPTAGTHHDQIRFSGPVALGGTLAANTIGGFEPPTGGTFQVLTYGPPQPVRSPRSSQGGWRPPTPSNSSSRSVPVTRSSMPARTGTAPKALTSHAPVRSLTRAGRAGRRRSITATARQAAAAFQPRQDVPA